MTTVGTARFIITSDNAQALQSVQQVAQAARKQLEGLKVTPTFTGFQAELKRQIQAVQAQVAVTLKPITQAQVDAAIGKVQDSKTVKVSVELDVKGDVATRIAEIKAKLAEIRTQTQAALTFDTTNLERIIRDMKQAAADLRAAAAANPPRSPNPNLPGQGGGGGGPPNTDLTRLQRELQIIQSQYERGAVSLREYLREMARIRTEGQNMAGGLQAGSREAQQLERVMAGLSKNTARLNDQSITKIRSDLAAARAEFERATAAAGRFGNTRDAMRAYETAVAGLSQRIRDVGERSTTTAAQLRSLNQLSAQLGSQRNAMQGSFTPVGLAGNVQNALKSLPQFAAQVGGSLGAAFAPVQQLTGGLGGLAAAAGPVGIALGAVAVAAGGLAVALKSGIDSAANFQQTLQDIRALTQPTAAEMERLKQATYDIGKPLGVGANEAAKAVLELNKAGLSAQDVIGGGLKGALELAGAAGVSAAEASTMVVTAMTAFGLASKDLPHIADIFANFANQTTLGASDLQQALAAVGPVARSSGIGMEQFAGIMATLAQGGFKNMSDAGTSLKTMLLSLSAPSDEAKKALKAIGLNVFDASGKMKPFGEIIGTLREKLVQLTPEAQKQVMKTIFGTDAIRAAEILARVGPEALDKNTEAMKKQGEASRVARERLDSLQGAQKQFAAVMEEVKNRIGEPFLKPLQNIVEWATRVAQAFLDGGKGAQQGSVFFVQWADTVRTAFTPLAGFFRDVFSGIATAWNTVLKPALTALWQIFTVIGTAVTTALGVVLNVVRSAFNIVAGIVSGFVSAFTKGGSNVGASLNDMASRIGRWAEVARAYITGVGKVAGLLPQAFAEAGRGIGQIFAGIAKIFAGFGVMAYDHLVKPILPILATVRNAFVGIAEHVAQVVGNMLQWVGEKLAPVAEGLKAIGIGIGQSIANMVSGLAGNLKERLFGGADAQTRALDAQAAAARKAAQEQSAGAKLVVQGLVDIKTGYGDVRGAVSSFGTQARQVWANVAADLQQVRTAAVRTRTELARPMQTQMQNGAGLASGGKTLGDIGLGAGKEKKGKLTVEDINALDAYKRKLDEMNLQQLQSEKALQTRLKDTQRLRLVNAEIHQREVELARAAKKAADEHAAAVRKTNDIGRRWNNTNQDFGLKWREGTVTAKDLLNYQQAVAAFRSEVEKLPKDQQDRLVQFFGQSTELEKRGQALVQLRDQIEATKGRVKELTVAQIQSNLAYWQGVPAAQGLVKALKDRLPIQQAKEYKAGLEGLKNALGSMSDAELASRLASEKGSDAQGKRVAAIEKEIEARRKLRDVTLEKGRLEVQKAGAQGVIDDYEGRVAAAQGNAAKLLQIERETGAKVLAARQELAQITAREEILAIQERFKPLIDAAHQNGQSTAALEAQQGQLIQAARDQRDRTQLRNKAAADKLLIDQTKETTDELIRLVAERMNRQAALEDRRDNTTIALGDLAGAQAVTGTGTEDLQARLQAEREFGNQVVLARQNIARRAADAELRTELIALAERKKISLEEAAQDSEFISFRMAVLGQLTATQVQIAQDGANKRIAAEKAVADAILQINRDLIDGLNQRAQSEAARKVAQSESDLQQELRTVGDNEQAKLDLLTRTQGQREQLARDEINARMKGEREAENRRWDDLQKSSQWTAADQQTRERLEREHQARLTEITTQGEFDKGQKVLAIRNQTEDQAARVQEKRAQALIKPLTKSLNDMTVAQRQAAEATLRGWLTTFQSMGVAGQAAAKVIQDALDNVAQANGDAVQRAVDLAGKLFPKGDDGRYANPEVVMGTLADRTNKIGKPDTRADAEAKGREAYASEIAALKQGIADANAVIAELGKQPAGKLNAEQALALRIAQQYLPLFTAQLGRTQQIAAEAGKNAGAAFSENLQSELTKAQDAAADASLQLAEANHKLAQAQGIDDTAIYTTNLQAYRDYWKGQIDIAQKGLTEAQAAETKARTTLASVNADPRSTNEAREAAQGKVTQAVIETTKATGILAQANTNYVSGQQAVIATLDDARDGINAANDARRQYDAMLGLNTVSYQSEIRNLDELIKKYPAQAFALEELKRKYQEIQRIRQAGIATKESLKLDFQIGFNGGEQKLSDTISSVAQGFGQLTNPLSLLATIIEKLNIVGTVMEGIFSAIEEPIKALQEPFRIIGQVLGSLIAANLQMLAPILAAVVNVFVALYDAIAEFIHKLTFGFYDIRRKNPQDSPSGKKEVADLKGENDKTQLDLDYRDGLISREKYEAEKLRLAREGLDRQQQEELEGAKGNAAKIEQINRKYDLAWRKLRQETLDEIAAYEQELAGQAGENDQKELDRRRRQGLITERQYQEDSLKLTLARLERERQAELRGAEGDQRRLLEINRKYDGLVLDAKLDMLDRLKEAYRQIGDTLMGTITGSIKDGLMAALRAGNFGLFRTQFRQKFREAMFEAVLAAAIETAAIKGLLQPAIDALTDAFTSGDQGAIDKAVQGLMTAGAKAEGMARKIYTALKPLRDAWGIKGENGEQSMTVTGQIDKPEVKISLDALRMLADVINQRLPAYADAINLHVPALRENTLALNTQVPVFSSAIDQFGIHEAAYQQHVSQFGGFVGQFGGFVSQFGQHVGTIAGAASTMQATAQGQASKGYGPSLGGGQYYAPVPKR